MSDRKTPRATRCFIGVTASGWCAPSTAAWYARDVRNSLAQDYGSWDAAKKQGWRVVRAVILPDARDD
jgi:hypothetical protein